MNIRESNIKDLEAIRSIHEYTFGEPEGKVVAQLACDIISDPTAQPVLSLVAERNGTIVGNIIFSSVKIEGSEKLSAYILAPLAVSDDFQKQGVGTDLINYGLQLLKDRGVDIVLVLGDPNYYKRMGFKSEHSIEAPYNLQCPEAWMALELKSGKLAKAKGVAKCAVSLNSPEHW